MKSENGEHPEIDKEHREELRWLILCVLYVSGEVGTSDKIILCVIQSFRPDFTTADIRKEMEFLDGNNLIEYFDREGLTWFARINKNGANIMKGAGAGAPGIMQLKER